MTTNFDFTMNQLKSLAALINFSDQNNLDLNDIEEIGYNNQSGNVYIAFNDGLQIYMFEGRNAADQIHIMKYDEIIEEEIEYDSLDDYYDDIRLCEI